MGRTLGVADFPSRLAQLLSQECAKSKRLAGGGDARDSTPHQDSIFLAIAVLFLLHQRRHRQSLSATLFLDFALSDNFLLLYSHLGLLAPHFTLIRWQCGRMLRVTADGARHVAGVWAG
jgi:hypothetical protein